jgi:pyruvate/2-oxoglutarate dehydrogenase complex dihydrolipoamide dehydrogenase (E3) component
MTDEVFDVVVLGGGAGGAPAAIRAAVIEKRDLGGLCMSYKSLLLATGSAWIKPDFPGADLDGVVTSDDLLNEKQLPKRVLLYGESPWLIEIGQFFNR